MIAPTKENMIKVISHVRYTYPLMVRDDDKIQSYVGAVGRRGRDPTQRFPESKLYLAYLREAEQNKKSQMALVKARVGEQSAVAKPKASLKRRKAYKNPFHRHTPSAEMKFHVSHTKK